MLERAVELAREDDVDDMLRPQAPLGGDRLDDRDRPLDGQLGELAEETGVVGEHAELPVEGPIAIVESISPERSLWSKHVVHVVFAGELDGSLEHVSSVDEAVRGHRLFGPDELDSVSLHPPIARFLGRWQPGDPCVYLGARWAE